jgi:hypothetical protein
VAVTAWRADGIRSKIRIGRSPHPGGIVMVRTVVVVVGVALGFGLLPACDGGTENPPCDSEKRCPDDRSCLVNRCVLSASLTEGSTCSASVQCEGYPASICGSNPFTCRRRCQNDYLSNAAGNCNTGEYCRPEPMREEPTVWSGTCVASECTGSDECRNYGASSMACVAVSFDANSCMQTCAITFTATANVDNPAGYGDTCGGGQFYCQPIGPTDNQTLVCLKRLDNGATVSLNTGDVCELVQTPCGFGDACVGESQTYCRRYCDRGANELDGSNSRCPQDGPNPSRYCCQVTNNAGAAYAVCLPEGC